MKALCIRSFRAYYSNVKNRKVKSNTIWDVFYGTTVDGIEMHLENSSNYIEISRNDYSKYFVTIML